MSIYRRVNHGKRSKFWTAEFMANGKTYRHTGFADKESARDWLLAESLKSRRARTGYVKPMLAELIAPPDRTSLIDQFCDKLRERKRDDMYAYIAGKRLRRLASECGWLTLGHVTAASLEEWVANGSTWRGKPVSDRTLNQFVDIAVEWGKWLASKKVRKLPTNPLAEIEKLGAQHNDEYRRSATEDELNKLLATCPATHRLYYLFRLYTPMRSSTIAALTWAMLHLDATPPYAATPAAINKSGKDEKHVIRYDVAQLLRTSRGKAKKADLVFPDAPELADLKADWEAAGVQFCDADGNRRLDFHAMRRTLIRLAKRAGVSLDDASLLLGHRDVRTTRKYYDEDSVRPELGTTVERIPALGQIRKAQ